MPTNPDPTTQSGTFVSFALDISKLTPEILNALQQSISDLQVLLSEISDGDGEGDEPAAQGNA
jgi:hypothetical protein